MGTGRRCRRSPRRSLPHGLLREGVGRMAAGIASRAIILGRSSDSGAGAGFGTPGLGGTESRAIRPRAAASHPVSWTVPGTLCRVPCSLRSPIPLRVSPGFTPGSLLPTPTRDWGVTEDGPQDNVSWAILQPRIQREASAARETGGSMPLSVAKQVARAVARKVAMWGWSCSPRHTAAYRVARRPSLSSGRAVT